MPNDTLNLIFYLSVATVLVIGLTLAWFAAKEPRPELAEGMPLATYPLAAEYAFPGMRPGHCRFLAPRC